MLGNYQTKTNFLLSTMKEYSALGSILMYSTENDKKTQKIDKLKMLVVYNVDEVFSRLFRLLT